MNESWNFWPFFGIMIWVIFWTVFGLIMSRIGWRRRHWHGGPPEKTPMDILKERYAKGEISKDEFEEKKKDIA